MQRKRYLLQALTFLRFKIVKSSFGFHHPSEKMHHPSDKDRIPVINVCQKSFVSLNHMKATPEICYPTLLLIILIHHHDIGRSLILYNKKKFQQQSTYEPNTGSSPIDWHKNINCQAPGHHV